jgi:DNA-binding PadR family transcriptional regulator
MHGYSIVKKLEQQSEGYFVMREGTIYPHLHQLEKDGLIEGYWETVAGDRRRRYYSITERGKAELERRTQHWREFRKNLDQLLGLT